MKNGFNAKRNDQTDDAHLQIVWRRMDRILHQRQSSSKISFASQLHCFMESQGKFRYFCWHGHVGRMDASRLARISMDWRSLDWWRCRQDLFSNRNRHVLRHQGRGCGRSCIFEKPLENAWKCFLQCDRFDAVLNKIVKHPELDIPFCWRDLCQHRDMWRCFSKWIVFSTPWTE